MEDLCSLLISEIASSRAGGFYDGFGFHLSVDIELNNLNPLFF
jgi:hypothetical protein